MPFDPSALARIIEGGDTAFKSNAVSYIFECPRCNKAAKLYVRKRDGRFVCWYCKEISGFQGRPEFALRELYGTSLADLRKKLYGDEAPENLQEELVVEFNSDWGDEAESVPPPPEVEFPLHFTSIEDGSKFIKAARYLHGRGITATHVKVYDIRYDPEELRVIFPVKVNGRLIGWQARYIRPTSSYDESSGRTRKIPKILTSDSLRDSGGRYLMFQDRLVGSPHCVLAEGPVSAIKAHLCGGNVASMGKAVTANQIATITSYGVKRIYLALDPDAAAEVNRLVETISPDIELFLLLPPPGKEDLGDCREEEVFQQFHQAPRINRGTLMVSLGGEFIY